MTDEPAEEGIAENAHGLHDASWDEARWREMAENLVDDGVVTWREITTTVLGELNPPQVGTQIASSSATLYGFKDNHATLNTGQSFWSHVRTWLYSMTGRCVDCGTRLDLQADHIEGRETYPDPRDADYLSNMTLRCRRHNVAKRKSHVARAGRTLLPAQQALMWILLEVRPVSLQDLARLCRLYGMTMSDIRFQEAWAMAIWLKREGHYTIAHETEAYDLLVWGDGAITRRFSSDETIPAGATLHAANVPGDAIHCFLAKVPQEDVIRYFEHPVGAIPFVYPLGDRPTTDIAIWPVANGWINFAPRGHDMLAWTLRSQRQSVVALFDDVEFGTMPTAGIKGKLVRRIPTRGAARLRAIPDGP